MAQSIHRWLASVGTALLCLAGASVATAAPIPTGVSVKLEGCRNDGSISLPDANGRFICPNEDYTSGNLGKGWNELDLVPYRLTLSAGNAADASQTYDFAVAVDHEDGGKPGYDVLSTLTLNTTLSSAGCQAPTVGTQTVLAPGIGGADETLYRTVKVTQVKSTTCVYDYYARLALGSHLYPGSSLHANLLNEDLSTGGVGARDVSIPVKEIKPQELRKDMTATADSEAQWGLTKTASPSKLEFGDMCAAPEVPASQKVSVRVEWKKLDAKPGAVNFVTHVYARNPASRVITVNVTDKVYKGASAPADPNTALAELSSGPKDVPAGQEILVLEHKGTLPSSAGAVGDYLNDVATATYIDKVTGIPVPGTVSAIAKDQIGEGTTHNSSVAIADVESITGKGLSFSVAPVALGSFSGYTPGTPTTGPVNWGVSGQTGSGSVTFDKTVTLDARRVTSGKLSDTAKLVATEGDFKTTASADVLISSDAKVKLKVVKSIPKWSAAQLDPGERYDFKFVVTRSGDPTYKAEITLSFGPGEIYKESDTLTGLVPDTYTVEEVSALFFASGATTGVPVALVPFGGTQRSVRLTAGDDGVFKPEECAGKAYFKNIPKPKGVFAKVQKITDPALPSNSPDIDWSFTLKGPGLPPDGVTATAQAGAGFVQFNATLRAEGTYTVTETLKPGWLLINVAPDANGDKVCEFKLDLPEDDGKTFACTFSNQKKGKGKVVKTVSGQPPTGSQSFTFQLRQNATPTSAGSILETAQANAANAGVFTFSTGLIPSKHYQLCEVVPVGWKTDLSGFVPNAYLPGGTVPNPDADNSVVCVDFTVAAGETKVFKVDNTPLPKVQPRTIGFWKNWASCSSSSGDQRPVLDQTLAKAEPTGLVVSAFAGTTYLALHGSKATPNAAPDCLAAVRLLDKSTINTGVKMASDPAFNLAAQLVAARLNYLAGAPQPAAVTTAINQAVALLGKVHFNGITHDPISAADAAAMRSLAETLDNYNNNLL